MCVGNLYPPKKTNIAGWNIHQFHGISRKDEIFMGELLVSGRVLGFLNSFFHSKGTERHSKSTSLAGTANSPASVRKINNAPATSARKLGWKEPDTDQLQQVGNSKMLS